MAEYGSMFLVSALAAILFFGGWYGPFPIFTADLTGAGPIAYQTAETEFRLGGAIANVFGVANLIFKATAGVTFMIWVRWTFPRLRIDQVITMCWKYCVPIGAASFVGSVFVWQYLGLPWVKDIAPLQPPLAVRESWVLESPAEVVDAASAAAGEAADGATEGGGAEPEAEGDEPAHAGRESSPAEAAVAVSMQLNGREAVR